MLSLAEARALLLADLPDSAIETLPLAQCSGRTLARALVASRDQPPQPVSGMDGYAVRAADAAAGAILRVTGEAPAGAPFAGAVGSGDAVRIGTGGIVPSGANAILIQENADRGAHKIRVLQPPRPGEFIRDRGCDFVAGQHLASPGDELTPARLGLAAAANSGALPVAKRPSVAIVPSGDELREPGSALDPGAIVNSAAYAIEALIESWGGEPVRSPIVADDRRMCEAALSGGESATDLIITIGGASVGDRDLWRPAARRLGARNLFDKVAVQPGKPCWHARFPDGRLLLGLPGNPASAFVCAHLFLKPLLFALTGRDPAGAIVPGFAILDGELAANGSREAYLRAVVTAAADGRLTVSADPRQDSSLFTPLAAANTLIRRMPHEPAAKKGDRVELLAI